jgi:capsular polysaccharide biosynthesis protein
MSPDIEEQWKVLSRDYDSAQKFYNDLLSKKSSADLGTNMETHQEGEQLIIGQSANRPQTPAFPNRLFFMAGGLGAGLGLGVIIAIWLEFSDKSIRTERDAAVAMDLPLLISVPWVGDEADMSFHGNGNGRARRPFWGRKTEDHPHEVKV